jgi:hypothetical protein
VRKANQVWVGSILALVGLATFVGVHQWMSTRTFVALDSPISLARGHIKPRPFKINLKSEYQVEIDTGWESYFDPNCPSYDRVKAHWVLYRNGSMVAKWLESSPYTYLGGFNSEVGTYELDLEVLSDTSCLNPGQPRLLVYTDKSSYEDYATPLLWISAVGTTIGLSLVVLGLIAISIEFPSRSTRISDSESIGQCFQWAQKLPLKRKFCLLPAFALLAAPCLLILIFVYMILLQPYPHKGLFVELMSPGLLAAASDPASQPVIVQVLYNGPGVEPDVHVNSKVASWGRLDSALMDELKLHPKWLVYVEADANVGWADVANAIDVAKGLHARVVLLTTKPSRRPSKAVDREKMNSSE